MRVVHHANYVLWFEHARVVWMDEHDVPYADYVEEGLHFATTRLEVDYKRSARFDDRVEISIWLEGLGGASLAMAYRVSLDGEILVTGRSEHVCVGDDGRVRRIPKERRESLRQRLP
jgi:acyl-CoA thioester hydrolase